MPRREISTGFFRRKTKNNMGHNNRSKFIKIIKDFDMLNIFNYCRNSSTGYDK